MKYVVLRITIYFANIKNVTISVRFYTYLGKMFNKSSTVQIPLYIMHAKGIKNRSGLMGNQRYLTGISLILGDDELSRFPSSNDSQIQISERSSCHRPQSLVVFEIVPFFLQFLMSDSYRMKKIGWSRDIES